MPKVSVEHQKRQRERIVAAAEACFANNGFHATSMDDVVHAAGMSTSTVYNYFPGGKNELIVTVCKERTDAVFERVAVFAEQENPPSLRRVYAEVALAFQEHMEKVQEEMAGDGDLTTIDGDRPVRERDGRARSERAAAARIGDFARMDELEPPEWVVRSVRLAVNAWTETIRNDELREDMQRRHSKFSIALVKLVDRWKETGVVDPALPTGDVVRIIMDSYFGAIVDYIITGASRYERSIAALERILSPRAG